MPRPMPTRNDAKSRVIRNAARQLFLQQGFLQTNTDAIAAAAGVSKATVYSRYGRKEELLADVLDDLIDELTTDEGSLPLPTTQDVLREQLELLARTTVARLMGRDYLQLVRVLIAEMATQPDLGELFVTSVPRPLLGRIASLLEGAEHAGLIRLPDRLVAARAFVGPLLTYVLMDGLLARVPHLPDDEQLSQFVDLFLHGLVVGPQGSR